MRVSQFSRLILLSVLVLVICLTATTSAIAHPLNNTASKATGKQAGNTPTLSTQQVKDHVRKTFGQRAVDGMRFRVTQPLPSSAVQQNAALSMSSTTTSAAAKTNAVLPATSGRELYNTSPSAAGYFADLRGSQNANAAAGTFNVARSPSIPITTTFVGVGFVNNSSVYVLVQAGVNQSSMYAYYQLNQTYAGINFVFPVNDGDQVLSEVYMWGQDQWYIFIYDQTTGVYFNQIVSFTTNSSYRTISTWNLIVDPNYNVTVPSFYLVTFTQAKWMGSSSSGWQPITAAPTYVQLYLDSPHGGSVSTTEIPDPPGTSFTLIPCPSC